MITPDEAQELASNAMRDYINACHCDTPEDVANALMKLASVCGVGMCAVAEQADAVARLRGTTDYIARPEFSKPFTRSTLQ